MRCWPSPPFARRSSVPAASWARVSLVGLALISLVPPAAGEAEGCAPLEACAEDDPAAEVHEPGPSAGHDANTASRSGSGRIVPLQIADSPAPAASIPGEALLALPKLPDGSLPRDFELGPGASIAESYWSAVLCATVARIVGPKSARPQELVQGLPDSALLVPHTRYSGAADLETEADSQQGPDPYLSLQHGLLSSGALEARSVSSGGGVVVSVLDSAPDGEHRDLRGVRNEVLADGPSSAPSVHGSLVAGVIAAIEENAFGIAGVSPGVELVAIPVCDPVGSTAAATCQLYDVLRGLDRSYELKARILNLSIVGPANALLRRSVDRLAELGAVVVAASGNEGTAEPRYPAAYASVLGVGAADSQGNIAALSNRGPSVQLLAPGMEILSTVPGDSFSFGNGTSLAAAHVTAVLAILASASGDVAEARELLLRTSSRSSPGSVPNLARVCDTLAQLGHPCAAP